VNIQLLGTPIQVSNDTDNGACCYAMRNVGVVLATPKMAFVAYDHLEQTRQTDYPLIGMSTVNTRKQWQ
jgi:hypothetical protein